MNDIDADRLPRRLREAREQANLNQAEAARSLGITAPALNQYESGRRRVDVLTLERLARLYSVPVGYFFREEPSISVGKRSAPTSADWEGMLHVKANDLEQEARDGIVELIELVRTLERLYTLTDTPPPARAHPAFPPLPERSFSEREVASWADRVRRHYHLGVAPLADLRGFLQAQGFLTFAIAMGREGTSGLFFEHPVLGPVVAVNSDRAYTRQPFTLAHELAHGLFHYDRPAILCRSGDPRPIEVFADRFAAHFLMPTQALTERLAEWGWDSVRRPEQLVHLARYFGVSYEAMRRKLEKEHRLGVGVSAHELQTQPVALARTLGYQTTPFEFGHRPLPPEERHPRTLFELAYQAVREGKLDDREAARLLGLRLQELRDRLEQANGAAVEHTDVYEY